MVRKWSPEDETLHASICAGLAFAGYVQRRCSGVTPPPAPDVRNRREWPLNVGVPAGYIVMKRQEHADDIVLYRALGPGGWQKDFPTWTMAQNACFDRDDEQAEIENAHYENASPPTFPEHAQGLETDSGT